MRQLNGFLFHGSSSPEQYGKQLMLSWHWEEEQENIGIFSQNKPEWFYVDFGAFANRAVTIPFYATSSPAQAQYIINDAQIRFLLSVSNTSMMPLSASLVSVLLCNN